MSKPFLLLLFLMLSLANTNAQSLAVLKYSGGGDWYANPTSLSELASYCNDHINTDLPASYEVVEAGTPALFAYPFIHMTGHGNVFFGDHEVENLRSYLTSGGFLHIDDNYGMDPYIRRELKKIFPEEVLMPVPLNHPIYHCVYDFPQGLPKIHEHDGKPPLALGIFREGRLVCLYTTESDLGDGWEAPEVHNDPPQIRELALKFGANLIFYAFTY